jgi:hypothetical protein
MAELTAHTDAMTLLQITRKCENPCSGCVIFRQYAVESPQSTSTQSQANLKAMQQMTYETPRLSSCGQHIRHDFFGTQLAVKRFFKENNK